MNEKLIHPYCYAILTNFAVFHAGKALSQCVTQIDLRMNSQMNSPPFWLLAEAFFNRKLTNFSLKTNLRFFVLFKSYSGCCLPVRQSSNRKEDFETPIFLRYNKKDTIM